jgi:hypothetical protein
MDAGSPFRAALVTLGITFVWFLGAIAATWIVVDLFNREHGSIAFVFIAGFVGLVCGLVHLLIYLARKNR